MKKLENTIYYLIEKSIKSYRQFGQKNIISKGFDITIDQWLVLTTIQNNPDITQQQIAITVFKDFASITRIIELMVKKNILKRDFHPEDRRRFDLSITEHGTEILSELTPVVQSYRKKAIEGITKEELEITQKVLSKIISNCK